MPPNKISLYLIYCLSHFVSGYRQSEGHTGCDSWFAMPICHREQILKCELDTNNALLHLIKHSLLPDLWQSKSKTLSLLIVWQLWCSIVINMFLLSQTMRKPVGCKFHSMSEESASKQRARNYFPLFTTVRIPFSSSSPPQKYKSQIIPCPTAVAKRRHTGTPVYVAASDEERLMPALWRN